MADNQALLIQGAPGSPYTRKMLSVLRYKHIPYRYINRAQAEEAGLPKPKVQLLPTIYFPQDDGGLAAIVDSTPLIRRLETSFPSRAVLPPHPAAAFLDALIEDYADEWLTKAMFHYRWHFAPDRAKAGHILPLHHNLSAPDEQVRAMATMFTDRQVGRLRYVGSNDTTAPVIEASYRRFLAIFDGILRQRQFLFGARPAAADFAVFGQLSQLAQFDPTSSAIAQQAAPRVCAWVDVMEDLSGIADSASWSPPETLGGVLHALLAEIGQVHAPLLLANERAIAAGAAEMEANIAGLPWRQAPFPYQLKCLTELRRHYAGLAAGDRVQVDGWLAASGIENLLRKP